MTDKEKVSIKKKTQQHYVHPACKGLSNINHSDMKIYVAIMSYG